MFYAAVLDILQEGGRGRFLATPLSLSCRNCCGAVDPKDPFCQGLVSQVGTDHGQVIVLLLCYISAAVLEHELVNVELCVLPAQEPDCFWLVWFGLSGVLWTFLNCNVFQDDGPLENLIKLSNIVGFGASLWDPLFPFLDFRASGKCEALATEYPFKVLNHSLGNTDQVAYSECLPGLGL